MSATSNAYRPTGLKDNTTTNPDTEQRIGAAIPATEYVGTLEENIRPTDSCFNIGVWIDDRPWNNDHHWTFSTRMVDKFKDLFYLDDIKILTKQGATTAITDRTNGIIGLVEITTDANGNVSPASDNAKHHNIANTRYTPPTSTNMPSRLSKTRTMKNDNGTLREYAVLNDAGLNTRAHISCASNGLAQPDKSNDDIFDLMFPNKVRSYIKIKSAYYTKTDSYKALVSYKNYNNVNETDDLDFWTYREGMVVPTRFSDPIPAKENKELFAESAYILGKPSDKFTFTIKVVNDEGEYVPTTITKHFWDDTFDSVYYGLKINTIRNINSPSQLKPSPIGDLTRQDYYMSVEDFDKWVNLQTSTFPSDPPDIPESDRPKLYNSEYLGHTKATIDNKYPSCYVYRGIEGNYARFLKVGGDGMALGYILKEITIPPTDLPTLSIQLLSKPIKIGETPKLYIRIVWSKTNTKRRVSFNYDVIAIDENGTQVATQVSITPSHFDEQDILQDSFVYDSQDINYIITNPEAKFITLKKNSILVNGSPDLSNYTIEDGTNIRIKI